MQVPYNVGEGRVPEAEQVTSNIESTYWYLDTSGF